MRAVFGLGGVLIVLGVIVFIMKAELTYDKTAMDAGRKAQDQISQVAGRDSDGSPVKLSATLEPQTTGGSTSGVLVVSLKADGPYAKFWGLKRNDVITEIGPLPVNTIVTDSGSADDFVMDAYQRQMPLLVMRDGQKMTLQPNSGNARPAIAATPDAATPGVTTPGVTTPGVTTPGVATPSATPPGAAPAVAAQPNADTPRPKPVQKRTVWDQVNELQQSVPTH